MIIGQYSNNNIGTQHILVSMWGYSNTNGVLRIKCGTQNSRGYSIQSGYSNVNEGTQFILISMGRKMPTGVLGINVVLRSQWGTQNSTRIFKCQIELEWWICTYSRLNTRLQLT